MQRFGRECRTCVRLTDRRSERQGAKLMQEEEGHRRRSEEEGWRRGGDEEFMWRRGGGRRGHVRGPGFPGRRMSMPGPGPGGPPGFHMFGPRVGDPGLRGMRGPKAKRSQLRA